MRQNLKIKYSKNVAWLQPFVDGVGHLVPVDKLTAVKGYQVGRGLKTHSWGSTITDTGRKFRINLLLREWFDRQEVTLTIEMILLTLAHELAHLVHWEHCPEHFKLQAKILTSFSKHLLDVGIPDHSVRLHGRL